MHISDIEIREMSERGAARRPKDIQDETSSLISSQSDGEAPAQNIRFPLLVRLLLFLSGMGVFARAEAFLLQTQVSSSFSPVNI